LRSATTLLATPALISDWVPMIERCAPDPETTSLVIARRTPLDHRHPVADQWRRRQNKVVALRNGTIGWTLAKQRLEHGADRRSRIGLFEGREGQCP